MTAAEVKSAVALLGFNLELSDDEENARFWAVLNMAQRTIAQFAPIIKSVSVVHMPTLPSFHLAELDKPYRGEATVDIPNAAAIYFEVIGTGEVEISRDGQTHSDKWENEGSYTPKRYLMQAITYGEGDAHIRFHGDFAYRVRHVCGFETLTSSDPGMLLPPRAVCRYDVGELCADFGEIAPYAPVWEGHEGVIPDVRVVSRKEIEIPTECDGVYRVYYRAVPKNVDEDHEGDELDLEPTLHHLVPLLVAHYLWMDDEPDKAAQYKANYDEQLALWRARAKPAAQTRVINATGW